MSDEVWSEMFSDALKAMHQGLDEEQFTRQACESALWPAFEERYRTTRAKGMLSNLWRRAEEVFEPGSREGVREAALKVVPWVFQQRLTVNEKRAALAILRVVYERGAYTFNVSERFLAYQAGLSKQATARACLSKLVEAGLLTKTGSSRRYGNSYRVELASCCDMSSNNLVPVLDYLSTFRDKRLCGVAEWAYYLLPEGFTQADVVKAFGVSRSQASRALKDHPWFVKDGRTYKRVGGFVAVRAENPWAEEQVKNREAVEEGYRNRQAKEANDLAEHLATLQDDPLRGFVDEGPVLALVDGDPFDNPTYGWVAR